MVVKLFANLVITTGTVLARSLAMAYKQAILRAEAGGAQTAGDFLKAGANIKPSMSTLEAKKILGLDQKPNFTLEDIEKRHDSLFKSNDPNEGGSVYLQKKIAGARICLEEAIKDGKEV